MVKIGPPYRPHPDAVPGNTVNNTQDDETKTLVEENPKNSPAADDSKTKDLITPENKDKTTRDSNSNETKTDEPKRVYEAWKVSQYIPPPSTTRYMLLGKLPLLVQHKDKSPVTTLTAENFYTQAELKDLYAESRQDHNASTAPKNKLAPTMKNPYENTLERRLRDLDDSVQRQMEYLIYTRAEANSTSEHRREYRIVCLREVPGGQSLTGYEPTTRAVRPRKTWYRPWVWEKPDRMEYRVVVEGTEVKETKTKWVWNKEHRKSEVWRSLRK